MMGGKQVAVYMPAGMMGCSEYDSALDLTMRGIAEAVGEQGDWCGKYGTDFENEVFSMHRYCWCDREDCPWCGEERRPNFEHKPSGYKVWWYKYIGRGVETSRGCSPDELRGIYNDCLKSAQTKDTP